MTTDLLTVTNLTKRYADYQLANVSFSLPAGYIMGFIGPNGAGKTTTIKAILDMIKPDSGNISVLGQTTPQARETIRDQLGIVLDGAVYPDSWPAEAVNRYVGPFFPNWARLISSNCCVTLIFQPSLSITICRWAPKSSYS